jgi:heme/copper-type cytochrome/quinol oxidase subunit 3
MSTIDLRVPHDMGPQSPIANVIVSQVDDHRGTYGILLFIFTEAFLFLMLFTAYFYLAEGTWRWLAEKPPKLHYVIPMLAILLGSSGVVYWGEKQLQRGKDRAARLALVIAMLMGVGFLALSAFDYKEHLQDVTPLTNAYGSIFYTLTTLHVAHVCLGLFMLIYTLLLPQYEPRQWPPYRPYHNATMYWHFVDFVWVFIVAFLYVAPNVR